MSSGITVEQLAKQVNGSISLDILMDHLHRAGIEVKSSDDLITDKDKEKLLSFLMSDQQNTINQNKEKTISLKRTSTSTLKMRSASGKNSTVNVVRKKMRTYIDKTKYIIKYKAKDIKDINDDNDKNIIIKKMHTSINENEVRDQEPIKDFKSIVTTVNKNVKEQNINKTNILEENKKEEKPATLNLHENSKNNTTTNKLDNKKQDKKKELKPRERENRLERSERESKRKTTKKALLAEAEGTEIYRRYKPNKVKNKFKKEEINIPHAFALPVEPKLYNVKIPETITIAELANSMSVKAAEIIKIMMKMGVMATINQIIDQDTACILVEEIGHNPIPIKDVNIEETVDISYQLDPILRPPVVTVMGHVDHGKTSLLDYIRNTTITNQEAGGITQHIGAYQVETKSGKITFLDTPGHSAFTAMRARGTSCTDIVVLVVAADDGVMPQTIEAIQHAKAANVPVIVAINKIDKANADPDKVINELAQNNVIPESWGGDNIFVKVSAKKGLGIVNLLESIMLQAEIMELKAVPDGLAQGVVIEARIDRGRGPISSILVQSGKLHQGNMLLAGFEYGRIKAMNNDQGKLIQEAGPCVPVEVLGLSGVPQAGDKFQVVKDERQAKEVALFRKGKNREIKLSRQQATKLEGLMVRMKQVNDAKILKIVLKADVQGSVEALNNLLEKISNSEIEVKVISKGVGGFNESDINLALASGATLIGFNVRADYTARKLAQKEDIKINYYNVIYDVVESIRSSILGLLGPEVKEKIIGLAKVREVFNNTKYGIIAGCMLVDGKIGRGSFLRVLRNNLVIYNNGEIESLRRFKDNVSEISKDMEFGIGIKCYNDIKKGDQIEFYDVIEVERKKL